MHLMYLSNAPYRHISDCLMHGMGPSRWTELAQGCEWGKDAKRNVIVLANNLLDLLELLLLRLGLGGKGGRANRA